MHRPIQSTEMIRTKRYNEAEMRIRHWASTVVDKDGNATAGVVYDKMQEPRFREDLRICLKSSKLEKEVQAVFARISEQLYQIELHEFSTDALHRAMAPRHRYAINAMRHRDLPELSRLQNELWNILKALNDQRAATEH